MNLKPRQDYWTLQAKRMFVCFPCFYPPLSSYNAIVVGLLQQLGQIFRRERTSQALDVVKATNFIGVLATVCLPHFIIVLTMIIGDG